MKILIIHYSAWSHYKIKVFNELYKLAKKEGHKIKVIYLAKTHKIRGKVGEKDLKLIQHPHKILFNSNIEKISFLKKIQKINQEINSFNPSWIIIPGYADISYWAALRTCLKKNIKIATIIDSTKEDKKRYFIKELFKKYFIKKSNLIFCYGRKAKSYAKSLRAENIAIRIQTTDNQTIINQYKKYKKQMPKILKQYNLPKNNIIYIGRLSKEKNIPILIKAFSQLKEETYNLIILGSGPEETKLKKLSKKLNLKNINFIKAINWKEVPKFLAISKILVLPSTSEPWGLVINEAMLCNVPVLVSKKCGSTELVSKFQIFNPTNKNELIQKLSILIKNPKLLKKIRTQQSNKIKKYTPEKAAKQIINTIKKN